MIYRIPSEEERPEAINILGNEFVDNKKDKCVLIVNRQEREVSFFIEIKDFNSDNNDNNLEVKLKEIEPIEDMSYILQDYNYLVTI